MKNDLHISSPTKVGPMSVDAMLEWQRLRDELATAFDRERKIYETLRDLHVEVASRGHACVRDGAAHSFQHMLDEWRSAHYDKIRLEEDLAAFERAHLRRREAAAVR
jgi:hypothetical protein